MNLRVFTRYGGQLLLALGPLLTLQWSLLDRLGMSQPGPDGMVHLAFIAGTKAQVELELALYLTAIGFVLVIAAEAFEIYPAARRLESFRADYLNEQRKRWVAKLGQQVRVNVMYLYRPWYGGFILRRLRWVWADGYRPPAHRDSHMSFWVWQGVCGRAIRRERTQFADLRDVPRPGPWTCWCTGFKLWPWQLKKTADVKVIISVPIFVTTGGNVPKWRCVGVINLDAVEPVGAELLVKNVEALGRYFHELGMRVAKLR